MKRAGAAAVFAPSAEAMYPPGVPAAAVNVPAVADDLEGARRPGHFAGVCRVVLKLLHLVRPAVVTFGRKDYQQLAVVRALLADLMLPVQVLDIPTMREPDGLAMSSRNRYLDGADRQRAVGLSRALDAAYRSVQAGTTDPAAVEREMHEALGAHGLQTDYAAVRDPRTLTPVDRVEPGTSVALIAARVGKVRLIDNRTL